MINNGTTEYLRLWPWCRIYWRRYSRVILYSPSHSLHEIQKQLLYFIVHPINNKRGNVRI